MKKIICLFLVFGLILPLMPGRAAAQLLLNPVEMPDLKAPGVDSSRTSAASSSLVSAQARYIPQRKISEDYKLGPGDQLEAHLIVGDNALALDYSFVLNPEGKIFFPNIGEIYLNSLTMEQARSKMIAEVRRKYQEDFSLSLMISAPKLIKIYVTGQVANPGLYTVYDGSTVSEVVKSVGIAPGGSNRKMLIKRKDQVIKVDLYDALYRGKTDSDVIISMGDVIEVPAAGSARVTVMGEVPRAGQYELLEGERLKDALAMAGYVGANSNLAEVAYLKRGKGNDKFENYKLNLYDMFLKNDNSQNVELTDGDIVSVPGIKAYVYVYGEVGSGGRLNYFPGQKLSDYINLSGGPTARANLAGVTVTRQEEGKPKVYNIDASRILHSGVNDKDIEIMAGDVVFVPGNFFYFTDFASFANTILLALTLYSTVARK